MERIAQGSGARVGGKLYSDASIDAKGDADLSRHDALQHQADQHRADELKSPPTGLKAVCPRPIMPSPTPCVRGLDHQAQLGDLTVNVHGIAADAAGEAALLGGERELLERGVPAASSMRRLSCPSIRACRSWW